MFGLSTWRVTLGATAPQQRYRRRFEAVVEDIKLAVSKGLQELHNRDTLMARGSNIVILSGRRIEVHFGPNGLHRDGGMAIQFPDGRGLWVLNGVQVPQWLAETPDTKLDPAALLKIDNAEIRREFVRKVGIERIVLALDAKSLDNQWGYELLELKVGESSYRYLKMCNPSTGTWHLEGVPADCYDCPRQACPYRNRKGCKCVAAALYFRNGTTEMPTVLT